MSVQQSSPGDPQRLAQEIEDLEYLNDVMAARLANIETANDERVPGWVVHRCMHGDAPALVWREFRKLERADVAAASGLSDELLTEIEAGRFDPGLKAMARVAAALKVDLDDLVPWTQESEAVS
jgi:hypothetical protein